MTDRMTYKTAPRHYWKITLNGDECFRGTFNECWEELVATFPHLTLQQLQQMNTRIARIK